jgi:predicted HTH domain antitoxin
MPGTLKFEWDLPAAALDPSFEAELVRAVKQETALRLFADGRISSGFGAELLGISRLAFIDLLRERRIPLFSYGEGELEQEAAAVDRLFRAGKIPA